MTIFILKEDEEGSQAPNDSRVGRSPSVGGGVGVKNSIFGIFRPPAPKLALVPGSCWYYDIDIWYTQVYGKCHQD